MEILLKHTVEEVNYILQALAQRPFAEVAELISKIKTMAIGQLPPPPAPEAAPEPTDAPAQSGACGAMDQSTINLALGAALAIAGWFARILWEAVQSLKSDVHQIEVDMPINYVRKDDMDKRMDHIEDMFKRIYDKLDGKADK